MTTNGETAAISADSNGREAIKAHVLRYELYRHRDISERLSDFLQIKDNPDAFNRSTWDILYFLMQCQLEGSVPSVTDIYLATNMSKGTAITGLAELERRGAVQKVRDNMDGRRRLIGVSGAVSEILDAFVIECGERMTDSFATEDDAAYESDPSQPVSSEPLINLLHQLSHELRTPLTAILGFSEMIADETLGPVQPVGYAEYARDIRSAASHLLSSMNDLVDTTLAEHGVAIGLGPRVRLGLEEVVDKACRDAIVIAERRGVVLRRKWGTARGDIEGDRDRLTQALRKIIESVVLSADRGNIVDVETASDEANGFAIRIISPENPERVIVDRAAQAMGTRDDAAYARVLPLVRAIAQAHGGSVTSFADGPRRHIVSVNIPAAERLG